MLRQHPPRLGFHAQRCRSPRIRRRVLFTGTGVVGTSSTIQRLESGDEVVFTIAYQVGAAHGFEGFAQEWPVVCVVVAEEGFVQAAAFVAADDVYRLTVAGDFA